MANRSLLLNVFVLFVLGSFTYAIKQKVAELDKDLTYVQRDIVAYQESMHVLKAEWSYLTRPERLQALVDDHMGLNQCDGLSLVAYDDVFDHKGAGDYQQTTYNDPIRFASASISPQMKPQFSNSRLSESHSESHYGEQDAP